MEKLIKLSFPTKEDWEAFKPQLFEGEGKEQILKKGITAIVELRHIQLPPAANWQPDPANPEDNGWTVSKDWVIDIQATDEFDHSICEPYLVTCRDRWGHSISGADLPVICKKS